MLISGRNIYSFVKILGCLGAILMLQASPAIAHHSYAMFDNGRVLEVEGTVAKLEWDNPHIFLWVYVADESQESGYELYAFETGSITMMTKAGWTRDDTVKVGEKIAIQYFPLFDGRPGGALAGITHEDGTTTPGDFPALRFLEQIRAAENGESE
jgi:hypothetical protein